MTTDSTPTPAEPLKPCPFCGAEPRQRRAQDESLYSHATVTYLQIVCDECDAQSVSSEDHADVIERWNRRATPAAAAEMPKPTNERTATDYALEFAEYLAKDAERLLEAMNAEDELRLRREESDDVPDDDMHDAGADRSEHVRALRNGIYEFRKRRDRATQAQPAAPEPAEFSPPVSNFMARIDAYAASYHVDAVAFEGGLKTDTTKGHRDAIERAITKLATQAQPAAPEPLTYAQFEAETHALPDDAFDGIQEPPKGANFTWKQAAFMGWLTAKLSATQAQPATHAEVLTDGIGDLHTSGVWRVERSTDGVRFYISGERFGIATVEIVPNMVEPGQALHNANLMAASPRLLRALRKALQVMTEWQIGSSARAEAMEAIRATKGKP